MKYKFDEDEVLLSRAKVYTESSNDCILRMLVTNKYLVFMPYYNDDDTNDESIVKVEVGLIKIYNEEPQIKKYEHSIEIYLTNDVLTLTFPDKKEEKEFIQATNKLLTGKTTAERNIETIGKKVNFFDKTFGTNTVETVKNALTAGVSGFISALTPKKTAKKVANTTGAKMLETMKEATANGIQKSLIAIGKTHITPPAQQAQLESTANEIDNVYDQLIKLKDLLDNGIITQEEFNSQKSKLISNN